MDTKLELKKEIMNNKEDLINKYRGVLLGARNSAEKPDYFVDDFTNEKELVDFVVATYDHETSFTKSGFTFIEEYYGIDEVVNMVLKKHPDYPFEEGATPKEALIVKKEFAID